MMKSRTQRRLALTVLLVLAVALLPVSPAAALPMGGWAFHATPVGWSFLWNLVAQVWEMGTARSGPGISSKGTAPTNPPAAPPQIGSGIDPHG